MTVRIEIDEAAIESMKYDWASPVGEIIDAANAAVAAEATAFAPVSPVGSPHAPPGFLRSTVGAAANDHYDETGVILGLTGTHTNAHGGGYPFPLSFIFNTAGRTRNPGYYSRKNRRLTGRAPTYRKALNNFLQRAQYSALAGFTYTAD